MRKELDEQLVREFPLLYADRSGDMKQTAMCWGFDCGDGWFQIIYDLSKKLEAELKNIKEQEQIDEYTHMPRAVQVKEKWGGLRFYMSMESDTMTEAIREAEKLSYRTCEMCGKEGRTRNASWVQTLCEECFKEGK